RSLPSWPAIRVPLNTREVVAHGPMAPGDRCLRSVPWDAERPPKPCRFMVPAKPFPLDTPTTSACSPGWKMSALSSWPGLYWSTSSVRSSTRYRPGFSPWASKWPCMGLESAPRRGSEYASCTAAYPSFSLVLICATKQGPALITVTGTARASSKIWVMPSFSPRIPLMSAISLVPVLQLDFDVHARRQLQALELLHGLGRGVVDVDQPRVREHLEVLSAVLVPVRRTDHRVDGSFGRKRHRPHHVCARPGDVLGDVSD